MPIPRVGELNSRNAKRLVQALHRDEALKKEATTQMKRSFPRFLERAFDFTPAHRKEMRRALPGPLARGLAYSMIAALELGGDIEYKVVPGSPAWNYGVSGSYDSEGNWKVMVSVTYEK